MKKTEKGELRLRIPQWILDELERTAKEHGIAAKPTAAAAAQVLEDWARGREEKRAAIANGIATRESRLRIQAARLSDAELAFTLTNCQKKIEKFIDGRDELIPMFELQYRIFSEELNRRGKESQND